jgi:hypothetical protein
MTDTGSRWQIRGVGRLRKAWKYGGASERFLAAAIVLEPIVALAIILPVVLSPLSPSTIVVVLLTGLMAMLGQPLFLGAQYSAVFTPAFFRAAIENRWMPAFEQPFYNEIIRYKESFGGVHGRFPGDAAWGIAYGLVYVATVAVAVLLTPSIYRLVGAWAFVAFAGFEVPVALGSGILYARRVRRRLAEADAKGFNLTALKHEMERRIREQSANTRRR